MTLLAAGLPRTAFRVDGVDVSAKALDKAQRAVYGSGSFRGNIGEDVIRFFEITPHGHQVTKPVTRQVTFHLDNLVSPGSLAGLGPYAIIFCRNLLIYLTPEARRQVFLRLDSLLMPGGLLFAGHTETLFWHQQGYLPLQWDRGFALAKPASPPSQKVKTTAAAYKLSPPSGTRHQEIKPQAKPAPSSRGKTIAASEPAATEKKQPVKPVKKDAGLIEPFIDEQIQEARRLADQGDMDGAMQRCESYARTVGPAAETYCLMGIIHMARQDMSRAEDCFLKALYLDPGHYESLVHTSLIYRQKGDEQKAALYRERAERKADTRGKNMGTSNTFSTKEDKKGRIRTN